MSRRRRIQKEEGLATSGETVVALVAEGTVMGEKRAEEASEGLVIVTRKQRFGAAPQKKTSLVMLASAMLGKKAGEVTETARSKGRRMMKTVAGKETSLTIDLEEEEGGTAVTEERTEGLGAQPVDLEIKHEVMIVTPPPVGEGETDTIARTTMNAIGGHGAATSAHYETSVKSIWAQM